MHTLRHYGLFGLAAVSALTGAVLWGSGPPGTGLMAILLSTLLFSAGVVARDAQRGVCTTALVCFASCAYLFARKLDAAAGPSACNVNEVLNCDVVNTSAASEMFGVPITLLGMGFYAGLAASAGMSAHKIPRVFQITTLFAVVNLVYSVYLAWQATLLGAFCMVCATIYVGNALLLWAGTSGLKSQGLPLFDGGASLLVSRSMLTIVGAFCIVLLVGQSAWRDTAAADMVAVDVNDPATLAKLYSSPRGTVEINGTEPVLGDPDAPLLVVEWADFGCPHCAQAERLLEVLVHEYPNVQVRFKPFPLSGACNPSLEGSSRPERCDAAYAAECARKQGKFWEIARLMFANQAYLSKDNLHFMANQVELDLDAWAQCMNDPATHHGIAAHADAGAVAGVTGTPALFLKGTHGDQFIEVLGGIEALYLLLTAHESGVPLLEPGPPQAL